MAINSLVTDAAGEEVSLKIRNVKMRQGLRVRALQSPELKQRETDFL